MEAVYLQKFVLYVLLSGQLYERQASNIWSHREFQEDFSAKNETFSVPNNVSFNQL